MNKVTQPTAAMKHASPKVHEGYWKPDGSAQSNAPKWAKYHTDMARAVSGRVESCGVPNALEM